MKAFVLAGGLGTRLRGVLNDAPKPMARFGDHPFLEYLVVQLQLQGFCEVVFCAGHLGQQIRAYFGDGSGWGGQIVYSQEDGPLGTGGALKLAARRHGKDGELLVMNGDSFLQADLRTLVAFHLNRKALATMALVRVSDTSRFGRVDISATNEIVRMTEKGESGAGWINGGIYVLSQNALEFIPDGPASLERDVFPRLIGSGFYGFPVEGFFVDIGVPEDLKQLQEHPEPLLLVMRLDRTRRLSC